MLLPSAVGPVPGKCGSNASASLRRYVSGSECQGRSLSCAAYGGGRSAVQQTQNIRRQLEPDAQDLYLQELLAAADPHADELDIPQFTLDVCDSSMHQTASATPAFQPGQQSFMQHAVQHQQVSAPARTQHRTHRQNFGQQPGHSHDSTEQHYEQRDSSASPHRGQRRSYHVLNNATSTQRYPARLNSNQQQQQPEQQQPNHYQGHGSQPLHPRALTHLLSKCRSLSELQQQCKQHLDDFNHVHVACAMNRLAKCPEATQPQYSMVSKGLMQTLEVLFVHHLPQYSAREVANALWCWAKVSHEPRSSTKQMVAATITAEGGALLRHHACTTQALANLAWGLAVLKWTDTGVWSCLTDSVHAALRRHQQTQPEHGQGGSEWQGGGWAGSGRGHHQSSSPQQRGAAGRGSASWHQRGPQTGRDPLRFAPVDLASLAFSYATARCGGMDMFRTLAEVAQSELQEFCALDLSNLLWACATMRYTPQPLFHAAVPMVVACITGFTPQGLANTAWAYAIAGVNSPVVFGALCLQAQQQATQMEPQHHSQLVWAMVRAKQVHPPVVHAAIASVMDTPDAWHTHNLARLLYSLTAGDMSQSVEFASLTPLLKQRLRSLCEASTQPATAEPATDQGCEPDTQLLAARPGPGRGAKARVCFQDVSQVLWAHAMAHAYDAELFELAQQLCLADTAAWTANPACFQSMIWSFGYAGHYHPALFQVAAQQLAALTPDSASHMSLSHIAGVLVSLAQIQHHDSAACTAAADHVLAVCRERPETVTNATLMNVLWALMLLGHLHEPLLRAALDLVARRWQVQSMYMQQAVPFGSRGRARKARLDEDDQGWSDADTLAAVEAGYSEGGGPVEAAVRGRGRRQARGRVTTPDVDTAAVPKGGLGLNGEHLYNKQMAQLLQIILWLQDEYGNAGTALVQELVPESLHSLAGATWREYTRKECMVSAFQNELCKAFQALGVPCKLEQLTADSLFSMDTVVRIGGRDVSVEANGPLHYTRTSPRTMLGNKVLRDRFVRARGYTVLNVPYWEWEEVENDGSAVAQYLYTRLVQELGPGAEAELKGLMADL